MASVKWVLSGKSVAESFNNAVDGFGRDIKLVGLVLGDPIVSPKYISSVVFVEETDEESVRKKAEQIVSYLLPDIQLIGLAKFPSSDIDLAALNINGQQDQKLCLKLPSAEELKQRNFKKLFDSNPQLIPKEDAAQLMTANGLGGDAPQIVLLNFDFKYDVFSAKEEFGKCAEKLLDVDFTDSEHTVVFGKATSSTMQKVECKPGKIAVTICPAQPISCTSDSNADKHVPFSVNLAVQASRSMSDAELRKKIVQQVERIFYQAENRMSSQKDDSIMSMHCDVFAPSLGCFPLVHLVNVNSQPAGATLKKEVCKLLNLPASIPTLGPKQSLLVQNMEMPGLLTNPHESVKYPTKPQRIAVVSGKYQYHHYMQDNFDDSGWGCAYRSFQTVWSWFRLQGLTDKPIPSHREMQQCLVDINDKPLNFVGSRQWIGSMELSFCLETMMGVSSRILSSKSGVELGEHARAIIFHFENYGAPIMIGGGQLAQTILGIDYNVRSGETRFLVLDPHYTGTEDKDVVVKKGWCGWKPMTFWDKKAFYNLLLPIKPKVDDI